MRLKTWGETNLAWDRQLDAHDGGFDPANDQEQQRIADVHQTQLLVVDRGDPLV